MASTPRPEREGRALRRLARTGAILALAGSFALALPTVVAMAQESPLPSVSPAPEKVPLDEPSRPVWIRVPYAGIDLPVVSSERRVPGNPPGYPLCDVAQYLTEFDLPGEPGTAWIIGHAQPGMFLPLFTISEATGGKGLNGKLVKLQLRDGRLLTYRITQVRERATTYDIAKRTKPREQRLILQTSTGPTGTIPKLVLSAKLVGAKEATEEAPKANPRACWQPPPKPTPKGRDPRRTPEPTTTAASDEATDPMTLLLGSGAVLLGATIVAVYLVRRQP